MRPPRRPLALAFLPCFAALLHPMQPRPLQRREDHEAFEAAHLAGFACRAAQSRGRELPEKDDATRTAFQRDRDRVAYSRAFRRLAGKTQVVGAAGAGDHFRTRLTHTMEVSLMARSLCRALGANADLAEAIALAHDLGHPPFGHAGEAALHEVLSREGMSFEHNLQSLRIVEHLEKKSPQFVGLNLTFEVREGLQKHRADRGNPLEARLADAADSLAYLHHDLDDALRAGVVTEPQLAASLQAWRECRQGADDPFGTISAMMKFFTTDFCCQTHRNLAQLAPKSPDDVRNCSTDVAAFSPDVGAAFSQARQFLHARFYKEPSICAASDEGKRVVKRILFALLKNPSLLPAECRGAAGTHAEQVKDFVAGMTDAFAVDFEKELPAL